MKIHLRMGIYAVIETNIVFKYDEQLNSSVMSNMFLVIFYFTDKWGRDWLLVIIWQLLGFMFLYFDVRKWLL